ncbi:MAG: DUF4864 domain-containing protein [Nitrospiria bacterium]
MAITAFSTNAAFVEDAEVGRVQSLIREQLAAFNADDYPAAYRLASSRIQSVFSLASFEHMVQEGYPQIAKSRVASFEEIAFSENRQGATALVQVTGMDRTTVIAQYILILEKGHWKNNGVVILKTIMPVSRSPVSLLRIPLFSRPFNNRRDGFLAPIIDFINQVC